MADFPEIGLEAVIENLNNFKKASDEITKSYDEMDTGASSVEKSSFSAGGALTSMAGILSTTVVAAAAAAAAAIAGVAVGIGVVGKAAFDMASDVNDATNNIQTDLGATEEEAERLGEIATEIWANNFGESVLEVSDALVIAKQRWEDINDLDLQNAVEDAFMLRDAFGVDIVESMNAAKALTEEFGITNDEAFDLITSGFQKGLNSSDDFLDSITEYSGLFGQSGAGADEFFSILETGLAGGVLGTDKAADLFKEFSIRIVDASDSTFEALEALTEPTENFQEKLADGTMTVSEVFTILKDRIADLDDPLEQQALGVALFGTQWEDLGTKAVFAIDASKTSLGDLEGSTDTLTAQYDNLGDLWQDIWRDLLVAIQPIGEALLDFGKNLMPSIQSALNAIKPTVESVAEAFRLLVTGDFRGGIFGLFEDEETLARLFEFREAIMNLTRTIFGELVPSGESIQETLTKSFLFLIDNVLPKLTEVINFVAENWNDWVDFVKNTVIPILIAIGSFITNVVVPAIVEFAGWIKNTLIPALIDLWKWIDKNIIPIVKELFEFFSKDSKKAGKTFTKVWKDINKAMEPIIEEVFPMIIELWDIILKWTKKNWPLIQRTIETVLKAIQKRVDKVITWIKDFWEDWGGTILSVTKRTFEFIFRTIKRNLENILDIITLVMQIITGDWEGAWETMLRIVGRILDQIKDAIETAFGNFKDIAINAINLLVDKVTDLFSELKNKIVQKLNDIKNSIASIWNNIKQATINAVNSMMQGIVNAIGNFASAITNKLRDVIQGAVNALLSAVTSGGIANTLRNIGQSIIQGVIDGVNNLISALTTAIRNAITSAVNAVGNIISTLTSLFQIGKDIIQRIIDGISNMANALVIKIKTTIAGALTNLGTAIQNAWQVGRDMIQRLLDGVGSMANAFKNWVRDKLEEWLGDIFSPIPAAERDGEEIIENILMGFAGKKDQFIATIRNNLNAWLGQISTDAIGIRGTFDGGNLMTPAAMTTTPIPASAAVTGAVTNHFNFGGNTITTPVDNAAFEARVMDVIRRNL